MDVGILILSPDRNPAGVRNSIGSIKLHSYNRESICVVGNDATAKDVKDMKAFCPTYKGGRTITSLINTGMKKIKHEWAFVIFGGSRIQPFLERKWDSFCTSNEDVLYPLTEKSYDFVGGSFNGVLMNSAFFKKVGDFPDVDMDLSGVNDFEYAKLLWMDKAISHDAKFKGIVGMRVI